jgi:MFS family permease
MKKDQLVTVNYCFILAANFLLFFGFYLLLPVLPFYLAEAFQANKVTVGIVLSCYVVAALVIRPFSGFLLDTFARKPLYIIAFFVFTAVFAGYLFAGTLALFTVLRIVHGLSFGTVTVAGNTLVIDISPASRRGESLGYYGLANNIAMAIGPMIGIILYDYHSFDTIFIYAFCSCLAGLLLACLLKAPAKPPAKREPVSLDRFILLKGLPIGFVLLLLSIPYGMISAYIAIYGKQIGIPYSMGIFFTLLAIGTAIARLFSGKQIDKGHITQVITQGMFIVCGCFFILAACARLIQWNLTFGTIVFFSVALFFGLGFGSMFPAFNTMFVNMAPNNQRGTATSTYLTSWDVGIGLGLTAGGYIAEVSSFQNAYIVGGVLVIIATCFFTVRIIPFYRKHKLR